MSNLVEDSAKVKHGVRHGFRHVCNHDRLLEVIFNEIDGSNDNVGIWHGQLSLCTIAEVINRVILLSLWGCKVRVPTRKYSQAL